MDLEVTWIHHWKKNGKSSTRTRPLRARAVQGLSGLALLKVDPDRRSGNSFIKAPLKQEKKYKRRTAAVLADTGRSPDGGRVF